MGCNCKRKFPSYSAMVKNLAVTFKNAVRHALVTGEVKADKNVIMRRISTCGRCPYFEGKRCSKCGCFVITKAGIKVSDCPMGYWHD